MTIPLLDDYATTVSRSTARAARLYIERFEEWRRGRPITPALLTQYRARVMQREQSRAVEKLELTHVRMHLNRLRRSGALSLHADDILDSLRGRRVDRRVPVVLSRADVRRLWDAAGYRIEGRVVRALLLTGARHKEVMALTERSVKLRGLMLYGAKTRTERLLPWELLQPCRPLFRKAPFKWSPVAWREIRRKARLSRVKLKDLRSTFATYLVSSGTYPPRVCADLCGHTLQVAEARYWGPSVLEAIGKTRIVDMYGLEDKVEPEDDPEPEDGDE